MVKAPRIRRARADEVECLSALAFRSKGHWGYTTKFMDACRKELRVSIEKLSKNTFRYNVAELDGNVVGYYALERLSDRTWELEALFVEPVHIGGGIGRLLIEHAKATTSELGGEELLIQGDPNAARFYRAAGGKRIGERESDSIPGRYLPLFSIGLDS
jgi:N-acetylglutamate synthase-like GNAT family acetyltransferase